MASVAERTDAFLGEHSRFARGRGVSAPAWLRDLRERGAARFAALGFPTVRQEEWRFTNVAPIAATPFRLAEKTPTNAADLTARVRVPQTAARIVILNGHFAPELSSLDKLPRGLVAGSLANAIAHNRPEVAHLGQMAWEHQPFVALNTAFLEDGAFIAIAPQTVIADPIHVIVINGGAGKTMAHPRTLIVAGANSQARIAQTFLGAAGESHFANVVTEVSVGENANVDLYTDQREIDTAYLLAAMQIQLQRNSTMRSRAVTLGGRLVRNDIVALLGGEGAHVALDGVYLVDGDRLADNAYDHRPRDAALHEPRALQGHSRRQGAGRVQRPHHRARGCAEDRRKADQPRAAALGRSPRSTRTRSSRFLRTT